MIPRDEFLDPMTILRARASAALLVLTTAFLGSLPALGQSQAPTPAVSQPAAIPTTAATPAPKPLVRDGIALAAYTGVISPDSPLNLTLAIHSAKALSNPRVVVNINEPLKTRQQLRDLLANRTVGWVYSSATQRLDPIPADQPTSVSITRTAADLYLDRANTQGVYPVDITLFDGNTRIHRLITTAVVTPRDDQVKVAIVGDIGLTDENVVFHSDDDLPTQAKTLIRTPAYDADLFALVETGQKDLANRLVIDGLTDRNEMSDEIFSQVFTPVAPIDQRTADFLRDDTTLRTILVPPASLMQDGSLYRNGNQRILSHDQAVTEATSLLDGPALAAWIKAYGALEASPDPLEPAGATGEDKKHEPTNGSESGSGSASDPLEPPTIEAQQPFVIDLREIVNGEDHDTLIEAINQTPWISPISISDLTAYPITHLEDAAFKPITLPSKRREHFEVIRDEYDVASALSYLLVTGYGDRPNVQAMVEQLFQRTSITYPTTTSTEIQDLYTELKGQIEVLASPPITMTGEEGTIPITLINKSPYTLRVSVSLISSNLIFPYEQAFRIHLRPKDATTNDVAVQTRTPGGLSSMIINVESGNRPELITSGTLSVRSTAYPVTALLVAFGAFGVLALWGWRNRQSARRRMKGHQ